MALLTFAGAVLAGGCADLMARSTVAPEWFDAKALEVKGEGYPDLRDVPGFRGGPPDEAEWDAEARAVRLAAAEAERRINALGPPPTSEEIRARAAQMRADAGDGETP
jgi:hypothetical protein